MNEKFDPLAPHVPEGMTPDEAAAEEERLKRLQFELELVQDSIDAGGRTAKISKHDDK